MRQLPPNSPAAGPAVAFEDWYRKDMPNLILFAIRLGAGEHEACDLAQQACVNAYQRWDSIANPGAYARTAVRNAHFKRAIGKNEKSSAEIPESVATRDPRFDKIEFHDQEKVIFAAIRQLPPRQREVVAWSIDGYKPAEIARILNEDPGTIRGNLHKARKSLKRILGGDDSVGIRPV
jgi:RNA polymerase sigma-70 factor (ECF subfamily)